MPTRGKKPVCQDPLRLGASPLAPGDIAHVYPSRSLDPKVFFWTGLLENPTMERRTLFLVSLSIGFFGLLRLCRYVGFGIPPPAHVVGSCTPNGLSLVHI